MDRATRDAVVKMGTALFKELHKDMLAVSSYSSVLNLSADIDVVFTDGTTHGLETASFPHSYPATLNVTLDGDGLLEYKYAGKDHLKVILSTETQDAYEQAVLDIFDAALDDPSVQGIVDSELDKAVDKVKDSATFQNVVSFLQKCGKTAAEAEAELRAAVMAWATENHLSGAEFKQSPLYNGGWLGNSAELTYAALQSFLDDTANSAAEYIYNRLAAAMPGAPMLNTILTEVTPADLASIVSTFVGMDLSGLDGTPAIRDYIFGRICEKLHEKGGKTDTFVTSAIENDMLDELETKIMGSMPDPFAELYKIQTLEKVFSHSFSELGDVLLSGFVQGAANEMSSLISKLQDAMKKLPDSVSIKINNAATIDKAALTAFTGASNGADAMTALANLLKIAGLSDLKPADFAVDSEIPVEFSLGGGTHTMYLCFVLE